MRPKILCLNGSLGGREGNTARLVAEMKVRMEPFVEWEEKHLAEDEVDEKDLLNADGFVITTGTYWDSWGSPLQGFLEQMTDVEGTACWMGKPAAVLVTMHAVGGKGVLSRLQGVLNTLGCTIPPMSGLVYSLVNQLALRERSDFAEDFWRISDLDGIAHNLIQSLTPSPVWINWPVDRKDPSRVWMTDSPTVEG